MNHKFTSGGSGTQLDLVSGLIFVIIFSLLFAGILTITARKVAPRARTTGGAVESYACGERSFLGGKVQFHLGLFNYALYFMIFDIIGFILFISWTDFGIITLVYLFITLVAVAYVSVSPEEVK